MDILRRKLAPITDPAWTAIDEEARRILELRLAGRRLVDVEGPLGWQHSGVSLGRVERLEQAPHEGVRAALRRVLPLVELRAGFDLRTAELDDLARGASDSDLDPLGAAAEAIAHAEDILVFHGYPPAGIKGILAASPHEPFTISEDYGEYPLTVGQAVDVLRRANVNGPYAIALGPRCFTGLTQAAGPGGYPVLERLRAVLDGPVVRAPAIDGAVVMSARGGDYCLTLGQDLSVGFEKATAGEVSLYLLESLTFRVLAPEAAVALRYRD